MNKARNAKLIQDLVTGLDHEDVFALMAAASTHAATLDNLDGFYPNPEARADASRLRRIAELLRLANIQRDFHLEKADADAEHLASHFPTAQDFK